MVKGNDDPANRKPFHYFNKGSMATISRHSAVAQVGKLEFAGYFAWLAWLVLHLVYLVGYRNRIAALFAWGSPSWAAPAQMAITSQMIYARLVMTLMEQQAQGALAAAEQAEHAEQEAAG